MKASRKLTYALVAISIVSITIIGLWSLNVDYIPLIRYSAIDYIKRYHPETIDLLIHLVWEGGRNTTEGLLGSERYIYTSDGWIMEITYPVIPNPEYEIRAEYSATRAGTIGVPYRIVWEGIYKDGIITEKSFTLVQ